MDEIRVSADEFRRNISRYVEVALRRPVAVIRYGHPWTVLISAKEYARLKRRDRQVLGLSDFEAGDIEALEASCPASESAAFNHEVGS
jgi:prevent-host-death family protein